MMELISARKIKINLLDYDFEKDIDNRLLMAEFSDFDIEVLEEILYSSIKIPFAKLLKNLNTNEEKLLLSLEKLKKTNLFEVLEDDLLIIDKQIRKYYEFQILKFNPDFKPDLEFMFGLLKQVPIQVLPIWYSLPRSSNNIFESIIEKYLITPHLFTRYLEDLQSKDPIINGIIYDVYNTKDLSISADDLKQKYNLSNESFEKYMLILEFNFALCLTYNNINGYYKEVVTPFYEWKEYLHFLKNTSFPSLKENTVKRSRSSDFAYIEDVEVILKKIKKQALLTEECSSTLTQSLLEEMTPYLKDLNQEEKTAFLKDYIEEIIEKLSNLNFVTFKDKKLCYSNEANEWLSASLEKKALMLYQHPLNCLSPKKYSSDLFSEKNLRKAEQCIIRLLDCSWIYFEDFIKGIIIPISEDQNIKLKKEGRHWTYTLPKYTEKQLYLIENTIKKWLFELAIITLGTCNGKDCIKITDFGKKLFEI